MSEVSTSSSSLPQKVLAVHVALGAVPHAFGGAICLGYYAEPRATADIDVNVFVPTERRAEVLRPLEALGVGFDARELTAIERDGQGRGAWGHTPVDLFFAYDDFHEAARGAARSVPFAGHEIPVLSPEHLVVCKTVFDRAKDWVDIDAMLDDGTRLDATEVVRWVTHIVGPHDARLSRIMAVLRR